MPCDIDNCVINDSRHLWYCNGSNCTKSFHALCAGFVQRNRENDVRNYMLPLCRECQEEFTSRADIKQTRQQHESLTIKIDAMMESNYKILNLLNRFNVHDVFENVELQLNEIKTEIDCIKKSNQNVSTQLATSVSSILKLNESRIADTIKSDALAANTALSSKIINKLDNVINRIHGQFDEFKSNLPTIKCSAPDMHDEIQVLKDAIVKVTEDCTSKHPSIQEELSRVPTNNHHISTPISSPSKNIPSVGNWRRFPNKLVWKPTIYWEDYDRRMKVRAEQEKLADKARRRHRQRAQRYRKNNGERHKPIPSNPPIQPESNVHTSVRNNKSVLPPDKQLLDMAKNTFRGNPRSVTSLFNNHNFIKFKQGETLHPHKTSTAITSNTPPATCTASAIGLPNVSPCHTHASTSATCSNQRPLSGCNVIHNSNITNGVSTCTLCRQLNSNSNFILY